MFNPPRSEFNDVVFPTIMSGGRANTYAILAQLLQSQWWPVDVLRHWQLRQAHQLIAHAVTAPHVRKAAELAGWSPKKPLTEEMWSRWPILERDAARDMGDQLFMTPPKEHGAVAEDATSGSTGTPLRIRKTELFQFIYEAAGLRDMHWAERDPGQNYALIKHIDGVDASFPEGFKQDNWGGATATIHNTGRAFVLDIRTPVKKTAEWLKRIAPGYLNTFPSMIDSLINEFEKNGWPSPPLKEVRTQGEVVSPALRRRVREVWNAKLTDAYSAEEIGHIAQQSPVDETKLLICAELTIVEILDDKHRPCEPGEIGRVVVTPLHNFAMPLIRYAIGDYAEAGEPSPCGRGLPVINRVLGRARSRIVLPDGSRRFAYNPSDIFAGIKPIRQYQIVQKERRGLTLNLVADRELNDNEARLIEAGFEKSFGHAFAIDWQYVDRIERSSSGKFEDIRSELDDDS